MLLVISTKNKELLTTDKEVFLHKFFHPSFRVENLCEAYTGGKFQLPDAPCGPPVEASGETPILLLSDSDEDSEEDAEEDANAEQQAPSLPPMLPPRGYSIQEIKSQKRRGRPKLKRIRSAGALAGDGARKRVRKRSAGIRQGRSSASAGRSVLSDFKLV